MIFAQIDPVNLHEKKMATFCIQHCHLNLLPVPGIDHKLEDISFRRGKGHCATLTIYSMLNHLQHTLTLALHRGEP
jgi:hypothetical protein